MRYKFGLHLSILEVLDSCHRSGPTLVGASKGLPHQLWHIDILNVLPLELVVLVHGRGPRVLLGLARRLAVQGAVDPGWKGSPQVELPIAGGGDSKVAALQLDVRKTAHFSLTLRGVGVPPRSARMTMDSGIARGGELGRVAEPETLQGRWDRQDCGAPLLLHLTND